MDKGLSRYYRDIEKCLPCSRKVRKEFLRSFQKDVGSYLENHPGCTIESVFRQFGKPEDIAEDFLSGLNQSTVQKYLEEKRKFWTFVKAVLAILAAAIIVLMTIFVADAWAYNHGQYYVTPAIEGSEPETPSRAVKIYTD